MTPEFNPEPLYGMVARDLALRFGAAALHVADQATDKMVKLNDDRGLEMWRRVRAALLDLNPGQFPEPVMH